MELHEPAAQAEVRSRFSAFRERVWSLDPHHLLSLTGLYTLMGGMGKLQREASYPEVAELEFLQALAMSAAEFERPPLAPDEVMPFWKELTSQYYITPRSGGREDGSPLEAIARVHATYYRNPYGDDFFDRMTVAITKEYDERYIRDGSFAQAGLALVAIRREIWRRFQDHINSCGIALKSDRSTVLELLRRLRPMPADEFKISFESRGLGDLRQTAFQFTEDDAVRTMFVLGADWIESQEKQGIAITAVLERLSLPMTQQCEPESLAAANPVWNAPVVKRPVGYALYSPITLTSFPFRCLLSLLVEDPQSKPRLEKIRGWFVEQEGKRLLESAFPSAHIVLGGYWHRSPGERIEADLLVLAANRLLILEAKGALIPDRVRSGARDSTAQFLKGIWGKATKQGAALADHVENATTPVAITDARGNVVLTLDPNQIRSVSRFAVSVEQVGPLMNAPEMLREAGVLNETVVAAPCIILSELAQVLRHASDELHKLHYLLRRTQVAAKYQIIGDEMDIYTTYLQYGFSELPDSDNSLMLLGASYSLDEYLDQAGIVRLPVDSALRCSPYFEKVLRRAKDRGAPVYLELGLMLLDMSVNQQQELESQLKELFKKRPKPGDWPIAIAGIDSPGERAALAVVLVDKRTTSEERRAVGMNVAGHAAEQLNADYAACILKLWGDVNPYDALYVLAHSLRSDTRRKARAG
jgi:hypothetical protein